MDWKREETWSAILNPETTPTIDRVIATDVIYNSSCFDQLARLMRAIKDRHANCLINVVIPQDRDKGSEFVAHMQENGFANVNYELLDSPIYRAEVASDPENDRKFYPGLSTLEYRFYTFEL